MLLLIPLLGVVASQRNSGISKPINLDFVCFLIEIFFAHHCFCFCLGRIVLRKQGLRQETGGPQAEGNVYLDRKPVCDNNWDMLDAQVACR